jgi:branched-chain amino acid transport system permease protein
VLSQLIINSFITGSIYALIALSFAFIYAPTKYFNLAHGSFVVVGAYIYYTLHVENAWPIWSAALTTAVSVGALGVLMYLLVFGPLRRKGSSSLVPMVASLGIVTIIQSTLALIYGSHYKSIPGTSDIPTYTILFGARITAIQLIIFLTAVGSCAALMWMTFSTKFGRSIVALSDSHDMARIVGINPDRSIIGVFFIGAALAGISGVLVAYDIGVEPMMGFELLLKGAISSIIGGIGLLWGAIGGGMILGTIENFGIYRLPVEWKSAIAFVVLVVVLLIRPQGIFNGKNRETESRNKI